MFGSFCEARSLPLSTMMLLYVEIFFATKEGQVGKTACKTEPTKNSTEQKTKNIHPYPTRHRLITMHVIQKQNICAYLHMPSTTTVSTLLLGFLLLRLNL